MKVFECLKKSSEKNILFIGPEGYGKSTQFKKCYSKILEEYSNIVPIYIDLETSKVINNGVFNSIVNDYCGELNRDNDLTILLKELFEKDNHYRYVVFIDHFENAIKEDIYNRTKNEILELTEYDKCSVVVASTYYDEKTFKNFDKYEFQPFTKEDIIQKTNYLLKDFGFSVDIKNLSDELINIISAPQHLYWFTELLKESNVDENIDIHSDYDLLTRRFEKCNNKKDKIILANALPKIANYCVENKTNVVPYSELELFVNEKEDNLSFVDRIHFAVKHFFEKDEDSIEQLNRLSKKYNIGKFNEAGFKFSNQVLINYFAANFYGEVFRNSDSIEELSLFNNSLLDYKVCRMISLNLKSKSKVIELLSQITEYNTSLGVLNENISLQDSKYLYLTANLVNIYYYFDDSYEYANFSDLDLRLCNFIGKNCCCAFFNGSQVLDECFVPIEPEETTLFAITNDAEYFITGNKEVLNIRTSKFNVVIDRILADEDNEFIAINYVNNHLFELLTKKFILLIEIINGQVSSCIKSYETNSFEVLTNKISAVPDNISCYGDICCVSNGYVLIKSGEKSYFGKAYLLFDIETEKLISVHPYYSHLKTQFIVQDGDEIEFLPFNDGKPLKTICFNERNKQIYKKQYPSMLGRIVEYEDGYEDGTKIYFDTNNCDSYFKYLFHNLSSCDNLQVFDNNNPNHYKISERIKKQEGVITKIITKAWFYRFNNKVVRDRLLTYGWYNFMISTTDYIIDYNDNLKNYKDERYSVRDLSKYIDFDFFNFNIVNIKNAQNGYYLCVGNKVYHISLDDAELQTINCIYQYEMNLLEPYCTVIDMFPWESAVRNILTQYNDDLEDALCDLCEYEVDIQIEKMSQSIILEYDSTWNNIFTQYIQDAIYYSKTSDREMLLNTEKLKNGIKNYCYPCDKGIVYYNGEGTCYLRFENGELCETRFAEGYAQGYFRNGVHYYPSHQEYNITNFYKLKDNCKSAYENYLHSPRIPIYDLELFGASFNDVIGLSAVVEDVLRKQTEIDTHTLTFDN